MLSLLSLLLYVILYASFLQLSNAAPAAACVVSYYTTTYLVPATPNQTLVPSSTLPVDIVPLTSDPPTSSSTVGVDQPPPSSTTPTLPTNGGCTAPSSFLYMLIKVSGNAELLSPTAALKFVAVGRGVQNYSCAGAGAAPVAIGAVATLYDFTSLAYTSETTLNTVPPIIVYEPISSTNGSTLSVGNTGTYPIIGHHYFGADGTPTFDLFTVGDILFCKKIASVNAPAAASVGPDGTGAVPWLMLTDKGGSVGVQEVYRVVTAGGKAPATCPDMNLISVQYAAEYWFFG